MLKKILYIVGFFSFLIYLIGSSIFLRAYKPETVCHEMEVSFVDEVKKPFMKVEDIERDLKEMNFSPIGKKLDSIDIYTMEKKLRNNSLFNGAELYATPSGKLHLKVRQKDPLFLVIAQDTTYYVSTDRTLISPNLDYAAPTLLCTGHINEEMSKTTLFDLVDFLLADSYWQDFFTQVYVPENEQFVLVPRVGNTSIIIGNLPNWEEKLDKLKLFIEKALPKYGWEAFNSLNLVFKDQVIAQANENQISVLNPPPAPIEIEAD